MTDLQNHINRLKIFFSSQPLLDLQRNANSISKDKEFPFITYLGLNFNQDHLVSIKAYFTFYQKLSKEEIATLLNHTDQIFLSYPYYKESKIINMQNTGCSFSVKCNNKNEFTNGFHHRFDSKNPIFKLPMQIELNPEDLENLQGISFEYDKKGSSKRKDYYYVTNSDTKQKLAIKAENDSISNSSVIEYTESGKMSKIILWDSEISGQPSQVKLDLSEEHLRFIEWMESETGLIGSFHGIYFNSSERSSYFMRAASMKPFDAGDENSFDTISYIQKKLME